MNRLLEKIQDMFEKFFADDALKRRTLFIGVTCAILFISFIAVIVHMIDGNKMMLIINGIFVVSTSFICFNTIINREERIGGIVLSIVIIVNITFTIITGGADGFTPFWILLLPSTAMAVFEFKKGFGICAVTQAVISTLLWTPVSHLITYDYSRTFRISFPILFFCSIAFAVVLESERYYTQKKLEESKSKLEQMSQLDDLTKLENRRAFNSRLMESWESAKRADGVISMLMIDIDYFKRYNDNYGHLEGDLALIAVANIIAETSCLNDDIAARWGGEEFAVLLSLTDASEARLLAESIIKVVNEKKIPHEFSLLPKKYITVSIGVATIHASDENSPRKLLELVDKSLYKAKEDGRDRVGVCMIQ